MTDRKLVLTVFRKTDLLKTEKIWCCAEDLGDTVNYDTDEFREGDLVIDNHHDVIGFVAILRSDDGLRTKKYLSPLASGSIFLSTWNAGDYPYMLINEAKGYYTWQTQVWSRKCKTIRQFADKCLENANNPENCNRPYPTDVRSMTAGDAVIMGRRIAIKEAHGWTVYGYNFGYQAYEIPAEA